MTWRHRVMRHKGTDGAPDHFAIHEVYDDGMHTKEPVPVGADDIDGLRWVLTKMMRALREPVIDYEEDADGNGE